MPRAEGARAAMRPGDRILRVNHAGEHGAVNIYAGQIIGTRWTASHMVDELMVTN